MTGATAAAAVELRQHACSTFYQLFIILTIALLPTCTTFNRNFAHGAYAAATIDAIGVGEQTSNTIVDTTATNVKNADNEFDLDATAVAIDSLLLSSSSSSSATTKSSSSQSSSSSTSSSSASSASQSSRSSSNSATSTDKRDLETLIFEPSSLDFGELAIGETINRIVTIFNRHANRSVFLGSISGPVPDFYSSFFEENLVPPNGNTTFNVVFLPRQQTTVNAQLVIHTSFGVLNFSVRGKGTECPYRLTPLIGLKAPLNATLTPEVHMYNPYDTPLQIIEVYSSGGQFQLELPLNDDMEEMESIVTTSSSGDAESNFGRKDRSKTLWEIPPYSSKPVIRVRFTADTVGNHTAYIRIKVSARNNPALENAVIVLPIEVEIFREHGFYSNIPLLNFGFGGSNDRPKHIQFRLLNSGKASLEIDTISVEADGDDVKSAVTFDVNTVDDRKTNETYQTIVATLDWPKVTGGSSFRGNILIRSKAKKNDVLRRGATQSTSTSRETIYRIPFVGNILRGSIQYNESTTRFHIAKTKNGKSDEPTMRDFRLKNNFGFALAITNLSMSKYCCRHFRIDKFESRVLPAGDETTLFRVTQMPEATHQSITCFMHVHTNVSVYDIEVLSFNGSLRRLLPLSEQITEMRMRDIGEAVDEQKINFGILPLSTMSHVVMAFVNTNPIPIDIRNWKGTISSAAYIGITVPGCSKLNMNGLKFCNNVKPGEWIVFRVGVMSNTVGTFEGKITVQTDYEVINTPIRFSTDMGTLRFTTKMTNKENCFPGGLCVINLTAYSTFSRSMEVENIQASSIGIEDEYIGGDKPTILANRESQIGQLKIAMPRLCTTECEALSSNELNSLIAKERNDMFADILARFRAMRQRYANIAFRIQTNHIKRYDFNGSIELTWPKMVDGPIEFPVAQVGHEIIKFIDVRNPSNETIVVYYSVHDAREHDVDVGLPKEVFNECWNCFLTNDQVFSLISQDARPPHDVIAPNSIARIAVKFMSENAGSYSTLLYLRSNFTVLEAIWLSAKAVVPQFKFGNRKPGSKTPLLFELTDKHLRDCAHPNENMRSISAKRTFTAKNSGEVPITLTGMRIDDFPCEGYGFRIADCASFELPPNASKKIEIAFTPDFTLAMVKKTLYIDTSLNYSVNYTLLSMIAPLSLGICSKALARPEWEAMLKNVSAVVLAVTFVFVILAAYLDSVRILKTHMVNEVKTKGGLQPTLDLRQIGLKSLFGNDQKANVSQATSPTSGKHQTNATTCNGKSNGNSTCKKRNVNDKKRLSSSGTTSHSEATTAVAAATTATTTGSKKSWTSEIAKKFTSSKKSVVDTKTTPQPKETSPGKPKNAIVVDKVTMYSGQATTNKRDKKHTKEELINEEEDASSTTTESSSNADEKGAREKVKKGKDVNQSKDQSKNKVKKTKSLPLTSEAMEGVIAATATAHKTGESKDSKSSTPTESVSPTTSLTNGTEERPKRSDVLKDSNHLSTPPSAKMTATSSKAVNGKTPGRERPRHSIDNSVKGKLQMNGDNGAAFKGTAFQFSAPLDMQKFSFSSIVQTAKKDTNGKQETNIVTPLSSVQPKTLLSASPKVPLLPTPHVQPTKPIDQSPSKPAPITAMTTTATKPKPTENQKPSERKATTTKPKSPFATSESVNGARTSFDASMEEKAKAKAVDLGPIGTRKSPSSTPLWEPMNSIQNPIPIAHSSQMMNDNPNSFFTGTFPPKSSVDNSYVRTSQAMTHSFMPPTQVASTSQQSTSHINDFHRMQQAQSTPQMDIAPLGDVSALLENVYAGQYDQNLLNSAFLLSLMQRQQNASMPKPNGSAFGSVPTPAASSPMYAPQSNASNYWTPARPFDASQPTHLDTLWNGNHEIRPPPGLSHISREQNLSLLAQNDLIFRHRHNHQQHQQQSSQSQPHSHYQHHQMQMQNKSTIRRQDSNELPPYDPFNSLSSIWSTDNWATSNQQQNQQQQHQQQPHNANNSNVKKQQ